MQKDFHYCCINALAASAGFDVDEAELIAFASQYVDDSCEHKPIRIKNLDTLPTEIKGWSRVNNSVWFDPVCTAHRFLQYLGGMRRSVQRKVYIPFHFLPDEMWDKKGPYDHRVRPGSLVARQVVQDAVNECRKAKNKRGKGRLRALIKLGISLHGFADSWSHQRFSGRRSSADNDIERIRVFEEGEWTRIDRWNQFMLNAPPAVGHAEAGKFPDMTHLTWRYEHDKTAIDITRHNTGEFLEAAETIYGVLCDVSGRLPQWKAIAERVHRCLSVPTDELKKKWAMWVSEFPDLQFDYDDRRWRAASLEGNIDWDEFRTRRDFAGLVLTATDDYRWFYFHIEAFAQRIKVLSMIRADLR